MRRYIIDNALMWLRDYHVDGLRLDAVHALVDRRATHLLEQLAIEVDALSAHLGRPLTLIAESDLNDPRLVTVPRGRRLRADRAVGRRRPPRAARRCSPARRQGYYADFGSLAALAKVLTGAFLHDGTVLVVPRAHARRAGRHRRRHARATGSSPTLQNHDQVGNRALGDRLSGDPARCRPAAPVGAALLLTAAVHADALHGRGVGRVDAVAVLHLAPGAGAGRHGRGAGGAAEFAAHGWAADEVPDPQDPADVRAVEARLVRAGRRARTRTCSTSTAGCSRCAGAGRSCPTRGSTWSRSAYDEDARWLVVHRGPLRLAVNLGPDRQEIPLDGRPMGVLLSSRPGFVYRDGGIELEPASAAVVELAVRSS